MNRIDELYLAHHGIEGQKWGVKHGPPYPLDRHKDPKELGPYTGKRHGIVGLSNKLAERTLNKFDDRYKKEKELYESTTGDKRKTHKENMKSLENGREQSINQLVLNSYVSPKRNAIGTAAEIATFPLYAVPLVPNLFIQLAIANKTLSRKEMKESYRTKTGREFIGKLMDDPDWE